MSNDFPSIPEIAKETGRGYQLPTFDVARVDHTQRSTFWLFLLKDGQRIGGVAATLQDIGDECASNYLRRVADSQYPNPNGSTLTSVSPIISADMKGKLGYIGELAVHPEHQGDRQSLAAFMRLVQVLALLEWDVDWTYGFIPDRHLKAVLSKQYGFCRFVPLAQTWREPVPEKRSSNEWWVAANKKELLWFFEAECRCANIL
ncbi:MAG: hypothetical protein JXQ88_17660 [Shimia sp.]